MSARHEGYIPAAGHDCLLPFYDPVLRILFREEQAKRQLLAQADVRPEHRVLDVGCGTGTLAILIKTKCPEAWIVGLDGDTKVLAVARRKAAEADVDLALDEGLAYALPYPDRSFDRVFSSMVFHHLTREHKERALAEILRVLTPSGAFHLLDFGRPVSAWERAVTHLLFRGPEARDNVAGRLAHLLREAGFAEVEELARRGTIVGSLCYYRAAKAPGDSASKS